MVRGLIDTSILVDLLRHYSPAITWFSTQVDLGVSQIVWLELLQGAGNKLAQQRAQQLLQQLDQLPTNEIDMNWAIQHLIRYKLSHNVGGIDCLIAAASHRLQIPLYTMNLKHFTPLLGSLAQKPY